MGTTTAVTVKVHPATPPTTLLEFHNHVDLDSLPDFDDDNKVLDNEYNAWVTRIKAMSQAQRLLSTLVGVAPDTSNIAHLSSVIHEATLAASGIPKTKAGFASDLQQAFQTGLQSLTDGLTISAALSASHFFIQTGGLIDVATSFITGTLLGLSSDGLFKTFPAGKFPPTAFVRASGKANYSAGGRVLADNVSTRFSAAGELEILAAGIDHGGLAGLGDDDHTQYSLVDGTRAFTGEVAGVSPTVAGSLATKSYVDSQTQGLDWKDSVRVATTAAGTLATDFENGDTIDGIVLATGNRIMIKNQAAGTENGLYTVNASGAPTRSTDYATGSLAANTIAFVEEGTANADLAFVCTNNSGSDVVNTDALVFVQFGAGGGDYSDGGEAGGAARTLGNTDSENLGFLTNNINRLNILANGDIAIPGTFTPGGLLELRKAGIPFLAQNTTDAALNQVAIFKGGNRVTPTDGDTAYNSFFNDDSTGTQVEFARIEWSAKDVTNTSKDGQIELRVMRANAMTDGIDIDGQVGQVRVFDGPAATVPGLAGQGDGDTGLHWPGSNVLVFSTAANERLRIDASGNLQMDGTNTIIDSDRVFQLRSFTVAGLPAVGAEGRSIFVSDETGGAVPAFSDGTNWRRVTDRAIIS